MYSRNRRNHARLLSGAAFVALAAMAGAAHADQTSFNIPAQPLETALAAFSAQSRQAVLATPDLTGTKTSHGVSGSVDAVAALGQVLDGTGLSYKRQGNTFLIVEDSEPGNVVQELVVTAQKKEEAIQTVPIAISAFTQKSLEAQHIEGGYDLLRAIPNVTFSKNNFTSYNFSIRGIGTKAVSATTDPGVAVSFNNMALIQNRLFEQEYFDVERVEVLRGPQGTLYGRNATAGVINVISAKPNFDAFSGSVKAEVGNYNSRRASAYVNVPLIDDKLAVRVAGAFTQREGYDFNTGTNHRINGRDLWSGRLTVGFKPFERLHGNFVWEHFNEDDDRSRTGKQLCHRDNGPSTVGGVSTASYTPELTVMRSAMFTPGCKSGSLYDADAFGTPNGLSLPFIFGMLVFGGDCGAECNTPFPLGKSADGRSQTLVAVKDPYNGMMQSPDLRVINSFRDPHYQAKADVFEFNFDVEVTDSLTFSSQTAYDKDTVYSFQDFNRFNTVPIFTDTSTLTKETRTTDDPTGQGITAWANMAPGGVFCDPQLGCSKSLAAFDISQAHSKQFSQEIRLQSAFAGPLNFSVGANYTRFNVLVDYYVMYNLITAYAGMPLFNVWNAEPAPYDHYDMTKCTLHFPVVVATPPTEQDAPGSLCPYVDPNPVEKINGEGHNYFRSKNPYKLNSAAAFGEIYWQATETLKVTAGLRYTDDNKTFTPVPSQILLAPGLFAGGTVSKGYPSLPDIKQHWGEFTGRLGVDWRPQLSFTDQTMVYAFYSRGYKGGGANPPTPGFGTMSRDEAFGNPRPEDAHPILWLTAVDYGPTFKPEFVNALEVGAKNSLLGGSLVLNGDVFFYDYKDYQISQIKDRTAVNENFDAKVWGAELESIWQPSRNLRINANFGYLDTRVADGMGSIDLMNRTQGHTDWIVVKPWVQLPSNCIAPVSMVSHYLATDLSLTNYWGFCGGWDGFFGDGVPIDPKTGERYSPYTYPEINGGAGFRADLGGNELPNSPHWTMSVGAQQGWDFREGWRATVRADAYWQSQSWARIYNDDPYDKLHGWYNVNLSLWIERPDDGLKIELYAKNVLDGMPITDAFLNSDDSALTTNVFTLDPRIIGLSITKTF